MKKLLILIGVLSADPMKIKRTVSKMNRNFRCFVLIIAVSLMVVECRNPYHPCELPHYVSMDYSRHSGSFTTDTLSLSQFADNYMNMVEGDTVVVYGFISHVEDHVYFSYRPYHDVDAYLYDTLFFEESVYKYSIQFLANRSLWLKVAEGMAIPNDNQIVIVKGVLHFDFFGPGVDGMTGPEDCAETSFLEVIEINEKTQ